MRGSRRKNTSRWKEFTMLTHEDESTRPLIQPSRFDKRTVTPIQESRWQEIVNDLVIWAISHSTANVIWRLVKKYCKSVPMNNGMSEKWNIRKRILQWLAVNRHHSWIFHMLSMHSGFPKYPDIMFSNISLGMGKWRWKWETRKQRIHNRDTVLKVYETSHRTREEEHDELNLCTKAVERVQSPWFESKRSSRTALFIHAVTVATQIGFFRAW